MYCYLYEAPIYLFFAPSTADVPALLYYSHIPTILVSLAIGLFVFFNGRNKLSNKLLLGIAASFSTWVALSLLVWAGNDATLFATIWPFFGITKTLTAVLCVYFIYAFLNKDEDVSIKVKVVFLALLAPVFIFAPTNLGMTGFNIVYCDAFIFEGLPFKYYYTAVSYLAMLWILFLLVRAYRLADKVFKQQIRWMGIGVEAFLFLFTSAVFIVTYLTNTGVLNDSRLEMYGLFGQTIFMVVIAIMIVRFKSFNIGLVAANALIIALLILVGSQITFAESRTSLVLTFITLILTAATGFVLARSVRTEIKQREQLEKLTSQLAKANKRLKQLDKLKSEFVSIASHQLRSPLTSIRGYASMLAEGSFGKLPAKAIEPVERISESSRLMAMAVEDYLNVSRIESGNMQYNLSDFNLKEMVEQITDDVRPNALKMGLVIMFRSKLNSKGMTHADVGKTTQIIHNLINNSIKYTPKGSINVLVRDDLTKKKIFVDVIDTGIGMSEETLARVFEKFERADNANSVNVSGTGLGLFVALKMANAMEGDITATSEGDGKGSTFTLELPLVQ